jgi:hypothetical protein
MLRRELEGMKAAEGRGVVVQQQGAKKRGRPSGAKGKAKA